MHTGGWANFSKYIVSLLKAWYGDAATPDNDFGSPGYTARRRRLLALAYFNRMSKGGVKGYFLTGQNPAGGGPNAGLHRAGLRNLEWLVVLDWFETESALFWKNDPTAPPPSEIKTEVFFIPAAAAQEKEARSPTRSGCSNGTTRRSIRPAIAVRTPGFSTTSVSA